MSHIMSVNRFWTISRVNKINHIGGKNYFLIAIKSYKLITNRKINYDLKTARFRILLQIRGVKLCLASLTSD